MRVSSNFCVFHFFLVLICEHYTHWLKVTSMFTWLTTSFASNPQLNKPCHQLRKGPVLTVLKRRLRMLSWNDSTLEPYWEKRTQKHYLYIYMSSPSHLWGFGSSGYYSQFHCSCDEIYCISQMHKISGLEWWILLYILLLPQLQNVDLTVSLPASVLRPVYAISWYTRKPQIFLSDEVTD